MRERTGLPAFVDNDANVAALAESLFGAAKGATDAVMLTIGTGIGGGLILGGEIYRGATGAGAELGHMSIDMDGPPCQGNCPNRGCIETLASGTALGREAREAAEREPDSVLGAMRADGHEVDGRAVTEAALGGDETAVGVFDLVGRRLGVALACFANIFEPEVIVIGGGVIAAGDLLLEPARRGAAGRALRPMNRIPVVPAELGQDAGMIGAAAMARIEQERGERADAGRADRLPDPDRKPRRHHDPRSRRTRRRRLHRLRGHPPHRRPARQARHPPGAAADLDPRGQRSRRGRPSWRSGSNAATSSPSSPTPACRRSPTPASG